MITELANAAYDLLPALEAAEEQNDAAAAETALRAFLRVALPHFTLGAFERLHIEAAVEAAGSKSAAAKLLDCSRRHIYDVLHKEAA